MRKLKSLQGLRFLLFLPIFMIHACGAFSFPISPVYAKCSVTAFFVLSGFLAAWQHGATDEGCTLRDCFIFAWRKVKKIYPLYLFSLIIAGPVVGYYTIYLAKGSVLD